MNYEIQKIQCEIILINRWRETQIYKNIFDCQFNNFMEKLNSESNSKLYQSNKKIDQSNKTYVEFSELLKICVNCIEICKSSITDKILIKNSKMNSSLPIITLKIITSLFKN